MQLLVTAVSVLSSIRVHEEGLIARVLFNQLSGSCWTLTAVLIASIHPLQDPSRPHTQLASIIVGQICMLIEVEVFLKVHVPFLDVFGAQAMMP